MAGLHWRWWRWIPSVTRWRLLRVCPSRSLGLHRYCNCFSWPGLHKDAFTLMVTFGTADSYCKLIHVAGVFWLILFHGYTSIITSLALFWRDVCGLVFVLHRSFIIRFSIIYVLWWHSAVESSFPIFLNHEIGTTLSNFYFYFFNIVYDTWSRNGRAMTQNRPGHNITKWTAGERGNTNCRAEGESRLRRTNKACR